MEEIIMAITAGMVKELREMTGAGMMDCKKALTATEGDMDKAVEFLREKGLATAQKKASRVAAEGLCKTLVSEDGKKAVVVEVNAETDFVAKNEKFQNYVADVAAQAMNTTAADIDAFLAEAWALDTTKTVKEALAAQIAVIGENMNIRRFAQVTEENGFVASYTHMGGKIGVLVDVETDVVNDAVKEMAKNVAMQIAAMSPEYLSKDCISDDELAKMKSITIDSSLNKPESLPKPILKNLFDKAVNDKLFSDEDLAAYEEQKNNKFLFNFLSDKAVETLVELAMASKADIVANKIFAGAVDGRMKKQLKEVCLLEQAFVRSDLYDGDVAGYIADVAKKLGASIKATGFIRYAKGEGIEKKEENYAEEIAKMTGNK